MTNLREDTAMAEMTSPEITYRSTVTGDLVDAPDLTSTNGSRVFRPTRIEVEYLFVEGRWTQLEVRVVGPQMKRDGSYGRPFAKKDYHPHGLGTGPRRSR